MIAFLANWKTWFGILLPVGGVAALLIPGFAVSVGQFLSTRGGRIVAAVLIGAWLGWMYLAWVEANAYQRGVVDQRTKIERQDNRAIEAARKRRFSVAECYAKDGEWSLEEGLCVLP